MDKVPLLGATRTRIVRELRQGSRTAGALAASLGIQVSAARKHLERLRASGVVEERFERGGPGRPKKFFHLTEEGRELFPRRYDEVLNALVEELVQESGEVRAEATVRRVAHRFAAPLASGPGTDKAHLRQLTAGLGELGFEPTVAERGGEYTIVSHNCPILRTAQAHRELVCRGLHAEILHAATGGEDIHRGKWIVDGDPVCTHTFRRA